MELTNRSIYMCKSTDIGARSLVADQLHFIFQIQDHLTSTIRTHTADKAVRAFSKIKSGQGSKTVPQSSKKTGAMCTVRRPVERTQWLLCPHRRPSDRHLTHTSTASLSDASSNTSASVSSLKVTNGI